MISIECPGCAAAFTVPEAKAGQTGRCPTCGTQVPVPALDLPFVAADSTPEPAGQESVEVRPCPGCQARIAVSRGDLGTTVECPYCVTRFLAEAATETPPVPKAPRREPDRPSRRRDETDDELDDDDDDRPRRRRRRSGSDAPSGVSTVGVLLIVGGIYGLLHAFGMAVGSWGICCLWPGTYLAIVWGILAIVRGSSMTNGRDSNGSPPLVLHILQILLIINFDVINMILGIIGLVLSNNAQMQDYYAGSTGRSDD